ncbi:RIO1 family protein [Onchocerca flexuosa]|uniref:Serine/threonine-protein kinase RIO3 n=1 Tax=Onchocerca flexuosa TaxID=387005 RepID=A0A238C3L4_9BILA|nr:RIO1 family protein [Onchocerca flexuosa]
MSSGLKVKESAWCRKESVEEPVISFAEIMSEELAEQLEEEGANGLDPSIAQYGLGLSELAQCKNDLELAKKLQEEFDREYEMSLKLAERKDDETKIEFGFERYRPSYDSDYDLEEELSEDDEDLREIAIDFLYYSLRKESKLPRPKDEFPSSGYMRDASGQLITKHDKEIAERRNSEKVMHLPIDISTGDVIGEKLSNRVYNKLRNYSKTDQRRNARVKDKDEKATNEVSLDKVTRLIIYRFINTGLFDIIENIIATGKESVVLHATAHADGVRFLEERHCALKVYKMTLSEFKNRLEYVQDDYRFKNPRRVLRIWAEKEYANLNRHVIWNTIGIIFENFAISRMVRGGVKCPKPIRLRKHIMIMTFIGSNGIAARKLKDIEWSDEETIYDTFLQVKAAVIKMFTDCNLVHGDLSEFNILYHENDIYIIDVSQAMDISHPRALFFLLRDIDNVLEFFAKLGTKNLPSTTELFNEITGLNMNPEKNLLVQVEHFEKDNRNVQLRCDKANPADMELRLYDAEVAETHYDPAEPYN